MMRKKRIDPTFYEEHDFGDDFYEAERNGTLIVTRPGENAIEAFRRHQAVKKAVAVSARVPAGVVNESKDRAAKAGISWSSYVRAALERALADPLPVEAGAVRTHRSGFRR